MSMTEALDSVRGRYRRATRKRRITFLAVAKEIGISPNRLLAFLNGEGNQTLATVQKIEAWTDQQLEVPHE